MENEDTVSIDNVTPTTVEPVQAEPEVTKVEAEAVVPAAVEPEVEQVKPVEQSADSVASGIVPPQLSHLADDFNFKAVPADSLANPNKKISPVKMIYAHLDYVIVVTEDGREHPMPRRDALLRADMVKKMIMRNNIDKPQDEVIKEAWIVYELVKAAQDSAEQCGRPYKQANIDKFLFDLDMCIKQMKRNKR
jgi:hypothetical protein